MSEIRQLTPEEVFSLDPVFAGEFDCELPDLRHARVLGDFEDDRLRGFVTVESQVCIGALYVFRDSRHTPSHRLLLDAVETAIRPTGRPLYAITQSEKVGKLLERRGARHVPFDLWRKDYTDG